MAINGPLMGLLTINTNWSIPRGELFQLNECCLVSCFKIDYVLFTRKDFNISSFKFTYEIVYIKKQYKTKYNNLNDSIVVFV